MMITDKINFKQPKYVLPAILYPLLLISGYLIFDIFDTEPARTETFSCSSVSICISLFHNVNILKFNDIQKRTESKNGTIFEAFAGFQVSCVANRGLP